MGGFITLEPESIVKRASFSIHPPTEELRESQRVISISQRRRNEMATTTRGRNQDRARVAAGQDHEVRYEAKKEGVSKAKVKEAVKTAGNSRAKVEEKLGK
jgi:hypothetical protein